METLKNGTKVRLKTTFMFGRVLSQFDEETVIVQFEDNLEKVQLVKIDELAPGVIRQLINWLEALETLLDGIKANPKKGLKIYKAATNVFLFIIIILSFLV